MNQDIGWTDRSMLDQLRTQRAAEEAHQERQRRAAAVHLCDTALRLAGDDDQAREWAVDVLGAIGALDLSDVPLDCGHPRSELTSYARAYFCGACKRDYGRRYHAKRRAS